MRKSYSPNLNNIIHCHKETVMNKYYLLAFSFLFMIAACNKVEFDREVKGEALGDFQSQAPLNNTSFSLNPATPNEVIEFTWAAAKPGLNTNPTYSVIFYDETSSVDNPLFTIDSDNQGKENKKTFTHQSLNELLSSNGIAAGVENKLFWVVKATNGSVETFSQESSILVKRSTKGATQFILLSPAPTNDLVTLNPNSTDDT